MYRWNKSFTTPIWDRFKWGQDAILGPFPSGGKGLPWNEGGKGVFLGAPGGQKSKNGGGMRYHMAARGMRISGGLGKKLPSENCFPDGIHAKRARGGT